MDIWEQGGGSRPLSPEELAGVMDSSMARPALKEDPYHPDRMLIR